MEQRDLFEQVIKANKFAPVACVVGLIQANKFTLIIQAEGKENFQLRLKTCRTPVPIMEGMRG
jgi:hypothetical protein